VQVLRLRSVVVWLLFLSGLTLVAGCGSDQVELPPPTITQEEILDNKQEGSFAGDRYNEQAVQERLKQMSKGDSPEEAYAYILSLVGESYISYRDTYASLENSNNKQQLPKVDTNPPAEEAGNEAKKLLKEGVGNQGELLNKTNKSMYETFYYENDHLEAAVAYLRDQMNYEKWSVIDDWVVYRWTLLSDYQLEKDLSIAKKILEESIYPS
jgi:hypothetical protein